MLIERESARKLARLGGIEKKLEIITEERQVYRLDCFGNINRGFLLDSWQKTQ
ncbi:MAG: hypothetical protein MRJ65_17020 [Candidatus Brocadiaceae bacterium]|nr:hypothetical protein [Candidatus Brocadiaceae bacterium]